MRGQAYAAAAALESTRGKSKMATWKILKMMSVPAALCGKGSITDLTLVRECERSARERAADNSPPLHDPSGQPRVGETCEQKRVEETRRHGCSMCTSQKVGSQSVQTRGFYRTRLQRCFLQAVLSTELVSLVVSVCCFQG
jgi:hypothetical protein